jgi:hypothetical protein
MSGYVYIKSEPHLFTVGFYDPKGKWHPDSDHTDREEAAKRVAYLNGNGATQPAPMFRSFVGGTPSSI